MWEGAEMTINNADHVSGTPSSRPVSIDELFRGVPPFQSAKDLACDGVFDTDTEVDELIAFTYADRHANLA
jgi:hypothetical protein